MRQAKRGDEARGGEGEGARDARRVARGGAGHSALRRRASDSETGSGGAGAGAGAGEAGCVLTEALILKLSRAKALTAVRKLNAFALHLSDISKLMEGDWNRNLRVLSLSANCISTLYPIHSCCRLEELYLRRNRVEDVAEVVHLRELPVLSVVWLAENPCTTSPVYREYTIQTLGPALKKLDKLAVTEDDVRKAQEELSESQQRAMQEVEERAQELVLNPRGAHDQRADDSPGTDAPNIATDETAAAAAAAAIAALTVSSPRNPARSPRRAAPPVPTQTRHPGSGSRAQHPRPGRADDAILQPLPPADTPTPPPVPTDNDRDEIASADKRGAIDDEANAIAPPRELPGTNAAPELKHRAAELDDAARDDDDSANNDDSADDPMFKTCTPRTLNASSTLALPAGLQSTTGRDPTRDAPTHASSKGATDSSTSTDPSASSSGQDTDASVAGPAPANANEPRELAGGSVSTLSASQAAEEQSPDPEAAQAVALASKLPRRPGGDKSSSSGPNPVLQAVTLLVQSMEDEGDVQAVLRVCAQRLNEIHISGT